VNNILCEKTLVNRKYSPRKQRGGGPTKGTLYKPTHIPYSRYTKEYFEAYHRLIRKPKNEAKKVAKKASKQVA
jgi:hypothetical protein